jgi:uncharacterized damage-inducible protein DinB
MTACLKHVAFCLLLLLGLARPASKADGPPDRGPDAPAAALEGLISNTETLLMGVATEMPEDKYGFTPTAGEFRGARSFAKQVKHAAAVQYLVADSILGETVTADMADERGPDSAKSKTEILEYLKGSFAALHRAAQTVDEANAFAAIKGVFGSAPTTRAGAIAGALAHSSNHYGQMVEYLRMNGRVPPASR